MTLVRVSAVVGLSVMLAGCAELGEMLGVTPPPDQEDVATQPIARPDDTAPVPTANAVSVEEFDTTTPEERAAAAAPAAQTTQELGTIVASLGDPTAPGFWAKTGLVDRVQMGRLVYPETGNSVQVELRPFEGGGAAGQVSLAALRVLGAPLTALPELQVFAEP
ncbi:hypothetical protein ATO10_00280 [Actibacterium atlanticum]|uniref:D-galactarate dehydratase n=1 Tax=Actibacterium atlanticum TaxID=1461693 RepID=A0A058ZQP0_9RHOB|nr:hypothetical protein [Actibacterium atlanticum]KCV83151.1 hypothetical protein ATO10_00280 [Actibacterium atlanticum]